MKDNLLDGERLITAQYTDWMVKTGGYAKDMTLRDHFAGLAMQQFFATAPKSATNSEICAEAYLVADAMLKERNK
jgi:hypothetical protein